MTTHGRNVTLRVGRANARTLILGVLDLMVDGRPAPERVTTMLAPVDEAISTLESHLRGRARTRSS